jgi:hypothetical protein
LLTPVPSAATGFTSTGDPDVDGLNYVNYQRAQVGMPAVSLNSAVATAALSHATYLFDNTQTGHDETAGLTGYTGATPEDRINAAYSSNASGEVLAAYIGITAFPSSYQPIESLFEAPFHRAVMLFDYVVAGAGYKQSGAASKVSAFVMDFGGYRNSLGASQMVAYPYNGQTNVETSWYANESPSPFEANPTYENTLVGYPVMLTGGLGSSLKVVSFTLKDAAGNAVPCQEMDESVDSEAQGIAVCSPFAELNPSTSYIATATGSMTKSGVTQNFGLSWEFTTASTKNVPMDSPSRFSVAVSQSAAAGVGDSASSAAAPASSAQASGSGAQAAFGASAPSMIMATPRRQMVN